jgi:pullulanase/glycogen debranching enzyme
MSKAAASAGLSFLSVFAALREIFLRISLLMNGTALHTCRSVSWLTPVSNGLKREAALDGRAQATGVRRSSTDATLLPLINGHSDSVEFSLPADSGGIHWSLLIDTNIPDLTDEPKFGFKDQYAMTARSLLLLRLEMRQ